LEFVIAFTWILLIKFHLIYRGKIFNFGYIIDPIFLFLIGQIVMLIVLGIVNHTGYLRSAQQFSFISTSYLLTLGLSFFIGSFILDKSKNDTETLIGKTSKKRTQFIIKFAFYANFTIGSIGTLILLKNFYYGSLLRLLPYFLNNFNVFEQKFFQGPALASILWRANFAVFFWAALLKGNWIKFIIIILAGFNIILRGAFLNVIVAVFYYIVPALILSSTSNLTNNISNKKQIIFIGCISLIIIIFMVTLNYEHSIVDIKWNLIAITPYSFGNFTNYNIYFKEMYSSNQNVDFDLVNILRYLGFGSIMRYTDKYFGTNFLRLTRAEPFNNELKDFVRYGNLASFYGNFTKVPYLISLSFVFFLGLLNRFVYNFAHKNLFILSVYSWFASTSFMAFAGSGYFADTKFFPAVVYIWPFLFIISLFNIPISHKK